MCKMRRKNRFKRLINYQRLLHFLCILGGVFVLFSSCKLYTYQKSTDLKDDVPQGFLFKDWAELDEDYMIVLHLSADTLELYDIIHNKEDGSIVGLTRDYEKTFQKYYDKAIASGRRNNVRHLFEGRQASSQIHINIYHVVHLDKHLIKFKLSDIKSIETLKPSYWNILINAGFIGVLVGCGLLLLMVVNPIGAPGL